MIRHIVLMRFRADVGEDDIADILADLHGIEGRRPGLLAIRSGRSESPEKLERGYRHGFTADFADWAALAAYQDDADHGRVGARIVAAAEGGRDGLLVLDIDVGA